MNIYKWCVLYTLAMSMGWCGGVVGVEIDG